MILITGANGNFGTATIDVLLNRGMSPGKIAGMVRSPEKGKELKKKGVEVRIGDYDDYQSMVNAFKGVDKLLLISGSDISRRLRQHENAVKAAWQEGVKHFVYTSFERRNETESSPIYMVAKAHLRTEEVIREYGMPFTILRNNLYMDGLPMFLGEQVLDKGIYFPAGDTPASFALREEMAEAASMVLSGEGHENRTYHIANSEAVSFKEIAAILSEIAGSEVTYTSPDPETYRETMSRAGVPAEGVAFFASFAEGVRQGEFHPEKADLERLLGRKPTTVKEFLTGFYGES